MVVRFGRHAIAGIAAAMLVSVAVDANALDRKDCERDFKPQSGQDGKDVIWVPTPDELVAKMLTAAKVGPQDRVFDLGSGDGKIAIAAAKLGARATGIEYNPDMVKLARCYAEAAGVKDRATIIHGDIFKEDFSSATVVTMYLLPELNLRLRPTILQMAPGTRVTSHAFTMGDWEPDEKFEVEFRNGYLWIVPAPVAGTWTLREQGGGQPITVTMQQTYQRISGEANVGGKRQPIAGARLRGDALTFEIPDAGGAARTLTATVKGDSLAGTLVGRDGKPVQVTGSRRD
jgi:SAM-dependent methyltransferase